MSLGLKCIKLTIFAFNFIFLLAGVGVMSVGIYAQLKLQDFSDLSSVKFHTGSIIVIAVGASISIVSFFGCWGAVRENRCLLFLYFVLLALILAAEVCGAVMAFTSKAKVEKQLHEDLSTTLDLYVSDDTVRKAFDLLQKKELCCGIESYKDWFNSPFSKSGNSTNKKVPDSCCKTISDGCGTNFNIDKIHDEGCFNKLKVLFQDKLKLVAIVAIFIAVLQVVGLIFGFTMIIKIGRSEYQRAPAEY